MAFRLLRQLILGCGLIFTLAGCQDESLDYIEVKRIHEQLTNKEIKTFLAIIEGLPDQKLPPFPTAYPPPAQWDEKRSLTVLDLVLGEEKSIKNHWNEEALVRQIEKNRKLKNQLRRYKMTPRQFIGYTRSIGTATGRLSIRDGQNIVKLLDQGNLVLSKLKSDTEANRVPFSELEEEERHSVLQDAMWLTRVHRIKTLQQVPPENVELVKKYKESLLKIFPPDFTENPIDAVRDLLVDYGLPFEEIKPIGSDEDLTWEYSDAIVGYDEPDEPRDGTAGLNRRWRSSKLK